MQKLCHSSSFCLCFPSVLANGKKVRSVCSLTHCFGSDFLPQKPQVPGHPHCFEDSSCLCSCSSSPFTSGFGTGSCCVGSLNPEHTSVTSPVTFAKQNKIKCLPSVSRLVEMDVLLYERVSEYITGVTGL